MSHSLQFNLYELLTLVQFHYSLYNRKLYYFISYHYTNMAFLKKFTVFFVCHAICGTEHLNFLSSFSLVLPLFFTLLFYLLFYHCNYYFWQCSIFSLSKWAKWKKWLKWPIKPVEKEDVIKIQKTPFALIEITNLNLLRLIKVYVLCKYFVFVNTSHNTFILFSIPYSPFESNNYMVAPCNLCINCSWLSSEWFLPSPLFDFFAVSKSSRNVLWRLLK